MANSKTDLSTFNNKWYKPGGNVISRLIWYFVNAMFFKSSYPLMGPKRFLLRLFGAEIGKKLIIKPHVSIKYPWNLSIGNHCWLGENVWIDNLDKVSIGNNVCISQGALILSGNHNYKSRSFDLMVKPIIIEDGVWIGAKSIVCQGIRCKSHSVLMVNSVANSDLEEYGIYRGNPAEKIKERVINN